MIVREYLGQKLYNLGVFVLNEQLGQLKFFGYGNTLQMWYDSSNNSNNLVNTYQTDQCNYLNLDECITIKKIDF